MGEIFLLAVAIVIILFLAINFLDSYDEWRDGK